MLAFCLFTAKLNPGTRSCLGNFGYLKSNPKQAATRFFVWRLFSFICLFTTVVSKAGDAPLQQNPKQGFVSLTLCSDRLLMAVADASQIAALSPYSQDANLMLGATLDKPSVHPRISDLLPYANSTILINKRFYPRLTQRLQSLGIKTINIDDQAKNQSALFSQLRALGKLTGQNRKVEALIAKLSQKTGQLQHQRPKTPPTVLTITENGSFDSDSSPLSLLFELLGVEDVGTATPQGQRTTAEQSLPEQILLANPELIISLAYSDDYSDGGQLLSHPILSAYASTGKHTVLQAPVKYVYCLDHGVWQGAELLHQQLWSSLYPPKP